MPISHDAKLYASQKHQGMARPNKARQPILHHLEEVASLAATANLPDSAIAASWLHDVIEDTNTTFEDVRRHFGINVAKLVDGLTDPSDYKFLPLKERKKLQADRLKTQINEVKIIKLCDQISNVHSVLEDPPIDWSAEKCLLYIEGAKELADISRGLAPKLDTKFDELYKQKVKYEV